MSGGCCVCAKVLTFKDGEEVRKYISENFEKQESIGVFLNYKHGTTCPNLVRVMLPPPVNVGRMLVQIAGPWIFKEQVWP